MIADRIFKPIVQSSPIEKQREVVFTSTDIRQRNNNEESKIKVKKLLDYVLENHDMYSTPIVTLPPKDNPAYFSSGEVINRLPNLSFLLLERARKINFEHLSEVNKEHMRREMMNSRTTTSHTNTHY